MADFGCNPVVPKLCSADPTGSATSSQGIRGYISVTDNLKSCNFSNNRGNDVRSNWRSVYLA